MTAPAGLWPHVARLAGTAWPPGAGETDTFLRFALAQRLLPLLLAADGLPDELAAARRGYAALGAAQRRLYAISRGAVLALGELLGADSFLLYKGADFRHRLYPRPELRPMADIDVLIPAAAAGDAARRLAGRGCRRRYGTVASYAPGYYEIGFEVAGCHVELHTAFSQPVRAAIDYAGVWRRRERFAADGIAGWRMAPADAILAQAFELAKDEFSADLHRHVDLHLLLQCYPQALPQVVEQARAWRIERALFGALRAQHRLFPADSQALQETADTLLDAPTRRFLERQVLPDPAAEASGHRRGRGVQLWRKFWLIDRPWRRGAFLASFIGSNAVGATVRWRRASK